MAEYIEREVVKLALSKSDIIPKYAADNSAVTDKIIDDIPAADVAPVVYGKWVHPHWKNSNYCYDCSVCGSEAMHCEYKWSDKKIYPICPNCGARCDL